jgi:hypothetical protein
MAPGSAPLSNRITRRRELMKKISIVASFVAIQLAAATAFALSPAEESAIKRGISSGPTAELPARVAELLNRTAHQDREAVATIALQEVAAKNPAAVHVAVVAMSKAAPELKNHLSHKETELHPEHPVHPPQAPETHPVDLHRPPDLLPSIHHGAPPGRPHGPPFTPPGPPPNRPPFTPPGPPHPIDYTRPRPF